MDSGYRMALVATTCRSMEARVVQQMVAEEQAYMGTEVSLLQGQRILPENIIEKSKYKH